MEFEIKNRNEIGIPSGLPLSQHKVRNFIGQETFYLHKIDKVFDANTGYKYDDSEPNILHVVHTDCNGALIPEKLDVSRFGYTAKDIMEDVQHILADLEYRSKHKIEIFCK